MVLTVDVVLFWKSFAWDTLNNGDILQGGEMNYKADA